MIEDKETPTWLKIMQNGSIGEARTRAFLIDRFWILERSVDIEGADFIIQRRITRQNLLDPHAPKLGIVQAKYYESALTTHYIPKDYVLAPSGQPRDEFFVIMHTGNDDEHSVYFLNAKTICEDFQVKVKDDTEKYKLPGSIILQNQKYKVNSKKVVLDRIENQLKLADFTKNRLFFSWQLNSPIIDTSVIMNDFQEPLDNWWGNIPTGFKELKENAVKAMHELELQHARLSRVAEEANPLEAFETLNELAYDCRNVYNKWSISLPDLYDRDFEMVCRQHKDKVQNLRKKGLLDVFIGLKAVLRKNISGFLVQHLPIGHNTVYSVKVKFSLVDLSVEMSEHQLIPAEIYYGVSAKNNQFGHIEIEGNSYSGTKRIEEGLFEFYWLAGRIHIDNEAKADLKTFYSTKDFSIYYDCMEQIYWEIE